MVPKAANGSQLGTEAGAHSERTAEGGCRSQQKDDQEE